MSIIPGLQLSSADDVGGKGITIPTFIGSFVVPESRRYGNCRRIEEFERIGKVSEGSFGTVYRCRERSTGIIYDLQKFNIPSETDKGVPLAALRQISILNVLKFDNVMHSYGIVAGKSLENNYLILDCCQFSIADLINKQRNKIYEEPVVKGIMKQLLLGIYSIHKKLIIHRGINTRNIKFSNQGVLKIAGFESAQFYVKDAIMSPDVNELRFRAPELLLQSKTYTFAVDMWAAGCVLTELVFKTPIFNGHTDVDIFKDILDVLGEPTEKIWKGYNALMSNWKKGKNKVEFDKKFGKLQEMLPGTTTALRDFICDLLVYDPKFRLTSEQGLNSSYFLENAPACANLGVILQKNVQNESGVVPMDIC